MQIYSFRTMQRIDIMSQYYYNPFGGNSDIEEEQKAAFLKAQRVKQEKHEIRIISLSMGCAIVAYVVIQNIVSALLLAFDLYDLYLNNAVFQYAFNVVGISFAAVAVPFGIMALINKKNYRYPVIPNKKIKSARAFAWVCFGMGCCIIANISVSYIVMFIEGIFDVELTQGELLEPDSVFACVMNLIGLSIIPAVCEELAMRCCSLQLLRKYGKGFGVFAVSIVFGLLHGNVVQFIFAFVVGLILGFATVQTDSIVPAIFIHALNNGMSVVHSTVMYASNEDMADNTTVAMYLVWFALGIASFIYLLMKKEFKSAPDQYYSGKSVLTNGQKFTAFLFPWMIFPFIILIILTALTIK